jgi:hypothetical protein
MNITQANNLDFPELLSRMGFEPVSIRKGGSHLFYYSPFRQEKEPSFNISRGKKYAWVWNDFGDRGGTVIDFVMHYQGHSDFKKALRYLEGFYSGTPKVSTKPKRVGESQQNLFSSYGQSAQQSPQISEDKDLEFIRATPVANPIIYRYLIKERCIPRSLISRYLLEVRYFNKKLDKEFFAFGMKNRSGGYEIRAASDEYKFKSALISRDITIIEGSQPLRSSLNIVEGMTDFLSLCAMYNVQALAGDTIILHSLSSYNRATEFIKSRAYAMIYTFLDNDQAGQKHTRRFKEDFGELIVSQSSLFAPHQDLNAALIANPPSKYLAG